MSAAWNRRLAAWTALGFVGVGVFLYGGITDNPFVFGIGAVPVAASIFMLGSSLWMEWPR